MIIPGIPANICTFSQGSNVNGRWFKGFDKYGNLAIVIQRGSGLTINNVATHVSFPTSFPDSNYVMWAWVHGSSTVGIPTTVNGTSPAAVFDGYSRTYAGANGGTQTDCRYIAVWVKS